MTLFLSTWVPGAVLAQPEPGTPHDVVRLRDGSFFRGTLSEFVPGDHVVLVLLSGEARRFPISDVVFSGSEGADGGEGPNLGHVRVESDQTNLQLLSRVSQGSFGGMAYGPNGGTMAMVGGQSNDKILCTIPCNVALPTGPQMLAVSRAGGAALSAEAPVSIAEGELLRAHCHSRQDWRTASVLFWAAGVAGGLVLMLTTPPDPCGDPAGCSGSVPYDRPQFIAGIGTAMVATTLWLVLGIPSDWVSIDVVSAAVAPRAGIPFERTAVADPALPAPETLQVRFRF